jgi:hypothetical protein
MWILKGVSSHHLACGCLSGVYETYAGDVVSILDVRGALCADPAHAVGKQVPEDLTRGPARGFPQPAPTSTSE